MSTLEQIRNRQALVGVIGLGYVGLPLVQAFGKAGFRVLGFDIDTEKVRLLRSGRSYVDSVPDTAIEELRQAERLKATDDFSQLKEPDCILICVPTPLTKNREPEMTYIERTAESIAEQLREGQLIVLESTTYPGTTREVLLPKLEQTGLRGEEDFYLGYSPEREDPGNPEHSIANVPKVVGGIGEESRRVAVALYECVAPRVVPVSSAAAAEATKLLENIYRAVNIALVNELKVIFDDMKIDVWEVIEAASTKPFGFKAFYPGPGWGGHCIPIDPFYLAWKAKQFGVTAHFIERAGEVNTSMTGYVADKITRALNEHGKPVKDSRILILGVAYKPDVDDIRESPALPLIERLQAMGGKIAYNDPHIPEFPPLRDHPELKMRSVQLSPSVLGEQDAVVVVTNHRSYDYGWIARHAKLIVDTRHAVPLDGCPGQVVRA